jgi:hypothetical protein
MPREVSSKTSDPESSNLLLCTTTGAIWSHLINYYKIKKHVNFCYQEKKLSIKKRENSTKTENVIKIIQFL